MIIPSQMAFQVKLFEYSVTIITKSSSNWTYQPTPNLPLIHQFLPRCYCLEDEDKQLCYHQLIRPKRATFRSRNMTEDQKSDINRTLTVKGVRKGGLELKSHRWARYVTKTLLPAQRWYFFAYFLLVNLST